MVWVCGCGTGITWLPVLIAGEQSKVGRGVRKPAAHSCSDTMGLRYFQAGLAVK
jgi:hypothetical protein